MENEPKALKGGIPAEESTLDEELEKWFYKWSRKVVTGRCLVELKNMDKMFIKLLKEELFNDSEPCCHGVREKEAFEKIDKLSGAGLV